ncbi:MAG TPA: hypothetical protein VFQ22_11910, partial [Longimicrobiales bacterium]|nr:hypothetical protein [Longimicrobiales bacterium]
VNDYTLVQNVMGFETVNYFEKELVGGRPVFRLRNASTTEFSFSLGEEGVGVGDIFLFGQDLVDHGRYAGREQIDGAEVHVIAVDDASTLEMAQPGPAEEVQFTPRTARFFVDAEAMVPRRIEFTGDAQTDDGPRPISMRMDMQDLQNHEGLVIPHRSVVRIDGLGALMDPEALEQLRQMEEQLAQMPPEQREMLERMMGPQLEQLRNMMSGQGDGSMTFEVTVSDVRVNAGPPSP